MLPAYFLTSLFSSHDQSAAFLFPSNQASLWSFKLTGSRTIQSLEPDGVQRGLTGEVSLPPPGLVPALDPSPCSLADLPLQFLKDHLPLREARLQARPYPQQTKLVLAWEPER